MTEENKSLVKCLTPLPETKRGFGIHIDATSRGDMLAYACGNFAVLRSLEDPSKGEVFGKHGCKVTVVKFSPNGQWVASGDERGCVHVWGPGNHNIKNKNGPFRVVSCVKDIAWSPEGNKIAIAGEGGSFCAVVDWESGSDRGKVTNHASTVLSVAYRPVRPFRLVTVGEDLHGNIHSGPPFKTLLKAMNDFSGYVNCVRYSPDGSQFATCTSDRKIFIYEGKEGTKVKELESKDGHTGSIFSLSWNADGTKILTASGDKTAKIWNVADSTVETTFTFGQEIADQQVSTLWFKDYLITVSLSGVINYLDVSNPSTPLRVIQGNQGGILCVCTTPDGKFAFTGSQCGHVTQWDLESGVGTWPKGVAHGGGAISQAAVANNGATLVTIGADDTLTLTDIASGNFGGTSVGIGGAVTGLAVCNSDSNLFAISISQKKVQLAREAKITCTVDTNYTPLSVAFAWDGTEIAVGGSDQKVHLYAVNGDVLSEGKTLEAKFKSKQVTKVTYSPDGTYVAAGGAGGSIYIWTRDGEKKTRYPYSHTSKVVSLHWAKSGARIFSTGADMQVIAWDDLEKFKPFKKKVIKETHFTGCIDSDELSDTSLVTVGADRALKIWNIEPKA